MKVFADNLKLKLKENKISQKKLAVELNLKQQSVSRWINNSSEPGMEDLIKICTILNTSPNELLEFNI